MANQYVNKFVKDGVTKFDLTNDTVTADTLVSGRTAHLASGAQVTGTFEPVTGVKGNAESTYRKGNVNLTSADIGAATSAQGAKADSAVQTIQIGGTAQTKTDGVVNLPAYPTIPTVNDGTLTIQQNGTTKATFTANQVGNTTANLTDTTYSAGNTMTLNNTTFDIGKRWTAVSKGQTWSRLFYSGRKNTGSTGILSISAERSGVAIIATFLIISGSGYIDKSVEIIEMASNNYYSVNQSTIRVRAVTGSFGYYYFEIYDTANNIAVGTEQNWNCRYIPLVESYLTLYTSFTDGTTIPENWVAVNDFTTDIGSNAVAIKNITRNGTTFTATRQDGSTFTFSGIDCLYIEAYNAGTAITIQNTSDFTLDVFTKYSALDVEPKFAFLKLSSSGMTYYLRAMINVKLASPGTTIDVSFIANGTTLYNFDWYMQSGTLSTPTITAKTLSFA